MNERKPVSDAETDATEAQALAVTALALGQSRYPGGGTDCPALETLVAWQETRLPAKEAQAVRRHVADCPRCFALWRELRAVQIADPRQQSQGASRTVWRGWRERLGAWLGAPLPGALAAGVALLAIGVVLFDGRLGGGAALPSYEVTLSGATAFRGETAAESTVALRQGSRFELLLRPATAVEHAVALRVWEVRDGRVRPLPAAATTMRRGLVLIEGDVGEVWALTPGEGELLILLGREGRLPALAQVQARLGDRTAVTARDWLARRIPIRVEP